MRPLSLEMVAFGPFAAKQKVDFNALGKNPLFLINGPTGSGKTTILDAICFALYGKTTGDEREGAQMRCDMADDELLTEVSFTFELGDRCYHIRRVPEQPRAKKSGEGFTVHKPEAQLTRIETDGSETLLVAAKVSEATAQIEQFTGLDVDQFRQVMVLPQGKFRELLMADSKAREKIFSQLFQTHIYRKIEDKLKFQAAGIKKEVEAMRHRRDGILDGAELENDEALSRELESLTPQLEHANQQKQAIDKQVIIATQQLEQANQLADEFNALELLKATAKDLAGQKQQIDDKQDKFRLAQAAKQLQVVYQSVSARKQEYNEAQTQLQAAQAQYTQSIENLNKTQVAIAELPALETQLQTSLNLLQQHQARLPQLQQLEQLKQGVAQSDQLLQQAAKQGQQLKGQLQQLNHQQQDAQKQLPALKAQSEQQLPLQQQLSEIKLQIKLFTQWQTAQFEIDAIELKLAKAKAHGAELKAQHLQHQQYSQQLQLRWHQGQAALLAAKLSPGDACPVCGSVEHPNLAQSEHDIPSDEAREVAQLQESNALTELNQARSDYRILQQSLTHAQQRQHEVAEQVKDIDKLTLEQLESKQAQLQHGFEQANKAQQQVTEIELSLSQWQSQLEQLNQQLEQDREQYRQLEKSHSSALGQLQHLQQAIPAELHDLASLEQEIAKVDKLASTQREQINSLRQQHQQAEQQAATAKANFESNKQSASRAQSQLTLANDEFNQQLTQSKFASEQAFKSAIITDDEAVNLEQQIKHYEQQCISNQANIKQLTDKLKDKALPDVDKLTQHKTELVEQQQSQLSQWQQLSGRMRQLEQTRQQLKELDVKAAKLEGQYAVVGTLSDVANGNTGNKISLQRFVLSVLLDDVLLEASQRLQLMSKGRYRLLRKEDRAKGNKASGLELEVEDAYTAKVRSVATLSGGESFMAALSMALGLSDVVQAYAGGIKLDTLFIDEGFGSLDQDSLELAIRTLMDLQSAGRMVGVISHVSEMKEQLGSRIDIIKTASGSRIELALP
ncbi:SMC family ATPase [Shewanella sp. Isolate11]|uniref:AAA family ATPase n=1 Tax=Shewanella sp. Isolate11 TaxID=2908530 RepID=UPI001EFDCD43|nr:SMC family ATPase [Shewanella sp. Isolate11]MCG9696268.1 SMC family ATPase [Shewanella sp. Isolate11]